ncbi:hypothetical protein T484DRAFT_1779291 [Baffinella frigidus]|nr:hypothetical protein T484DRAFT_1779291 [Cryptophyta sp. CCMP2293]
MLTFRKKDKGKDSLPTYEEGAPAGGGAGKTEWDEARLKARRKEAKETLARVEEGAASPMEVLQMAKYLGMDTSDRSFFWIAQEALKAELPEVWEEHKAEDGAVFYYSPTTKESSWEHPLDGYFRFLYKKLRKMKKYNKNGRGGGKPEDMAQDRELVDLLWAMEQEQRKNDLLAASDTSSFYESSVASRPSGSDPSWGSQSQSASSSFDSGSIP